MPQQFSGSSEEWHDFATGIATDPGPREPGYGVRPYDPASRPAPVPEPTPVPPGVRVVTIQRDGYGDVVKHVTVESAQQPAAGVNLGLLFVLGGVVFVTWLLHRFVYARSAPPRSA